MKKFFALLILAASLVGGIASGADDEVAKAKAQLNREIEILNKVSFYVERPDLGRLNFLRDASQRVLEMIAKKGLSHSATIREYQTLIVAYRYSMAYLRRISTEEIEPMLQEILRINEEIIADRGFDDSPYTQITYSTFAQLHKLSTDLVALNLSDRLKAEVTDMLPEFGNVLALAKEGDRPRTFEAAKRLYSRIKLLYPEFQQISSSNQAFDIVLSIQGLAEFYAEFAQIEE